MQFLILCLISWASNKVASRKEMPVTMDNGRLKDIQDWDDQTREEEWHEVGAVGDSCHRCAGVGHYARECPTVKSKGKGKGKGKSKGKGFDGARAEKMAMGRERKEHGQRRKQDWIARSVSAMGVVSMAIVLPIARNGRLLRLSKVRKLKPKHKMTNRFQELKRFQALKEEDDGEMAHPPGLAGTYDVCAVQKSQKVNQVEVTVDSGAESVWPGKLLQKIPTVKG